MVLNQLNENEGNASSSKRKHSVLYDVIEYTSIRLLGY